MKTSLSLLPLVSFSLLAACSGTDTEMGGAQPSLGNVSQNLVGPATKPLSFNTVVKTCRSGQNNQDTCVDTIGENLQATRGSAVLIGRNILLTTGAPVCANVTNFPVWVSGKSFLPKNVKSSFPHAGAVCTTALVDGRFAAHDIAIATLDSLTNFQKSEYFEPYLNKDFQSKFQSGVFSNPLLTGWGLTSLGAEPLNPANYQEGRQAPVALSRILFKGSVSPDLWMELEADLSFSTVVNAKGDGGGPLIIDEGSTRWVGALHSIKDPATQQGYYAPTWDHTDFSPSQAPNRIPNGEFIRQTLAQIDKDSDGISDDLDNCSPDKHCPGNPTACSNFDQVDLNANGIGDICDPACKANDCDGDGLGAACDPDNDNDGVTDTLDNCLCNSNPGQADSDGDGVGDACDSCDNNLPDLDGDGIPDACAQDVCPCSPPADEATDSDQVCNTCRPELGPFCAQYCPTAKLDNCPDVNNNDQANCNEEAELARDARLMGNACDPVPCPKFTAVQGEEEVVKTMQTTKITNDGDLLTTTTQESNMAQNRMSVKPLGSRSTGKAPATLAKGQEAPVSVPLTGYRFCLDTFNTNCLEKEYVSDAFITDKFEQKRDEEKVDDRWYRVTFKDGLDAETFEGNRSYFSSNSWEKEWDFVSDFKYWTEPGRWGAQFLNPPPLQDGQGAGRFWIWGNSPVGTTDTSKGTGLHPKLDGSTAGGLVNHYQSLLPVTYSTKKFYKFTELPKYKPGPIVYDCYYCAKVNYLPSIFQGPDLFQISKAVGGIEEGQALPLVSVDDTDFGLLLPDGSIADVTAALGNGAKLALTSGQTVVSQAEPSAYMGRGPASPSALGLRPDGTGVAERFFFQDGRLLGQRDVCEGRLCSASTDLPEGGTEEEGTNVQPTAVPLAASVSGTGPSARQDFSSVYSRSRGQLFLVGGRFAETQENTREIWSYNLEGSLWSRVVPEGYTPQQVLAATYAASDRKLWILDQVGLPKLPIARLVRVDPETGATQVVGFWPRLGKQDRYWLVNDLDGGVLLVTSSIKQKSHIIVRLTAAPSVKVAGLYTGKHSLAFAPVVDASGYLLTLQNQAKGKMDVKRIQNIPAKPNLWSLLQGCFLHEPRSLPCWRFPSRLRLPPPLSWLCFLFRGGPPHESGGRWLWWPRWSERFGRLGGARYRRSDRQGRFLRWGLLGWHGSSGAGQEWLRSSTAAILRSGGVGALYGLVV
jgi:hypothetical protein